MDWAQTFTIVGTTLGATFGFYLIIRDDIKSMDNRHREDMVRMDERFIRMDKKWERLFEKLFDKEQENKVKI